MNPAISRMSWLSKLLSTPVHKGVFNGTWTGSGDIVESLNPSNNQVIGRVQNGTLVELDETIKKQLAAKVVWRQIPAPERGEIVRQIREALSDRKEELGNLIALEMGKIVPEGLGEVQEFIDICDYAVGLSRMLNGKVVPSERRGHVMMENWNPVGLSAVISAFNFPCAVFGWNAALSLVCGNTVLWKGSPSTNLTSVAVSQIISQVFVKNNLPAEICSLVCGGADIGEAIAKDKRIDLVSFTGSTKVGRRVGEIVQSRFGKSILELGGNNAIIGI